MAAPLEVLIDGTFDPDDGPQPLSLAWDFGDGTAVGYVAGDPPEQSD
jgi:hypothetical protein